MKATLLAFLAPALLAACSVDGSTGDTETNRGPIGKADAAGSCSLPEGGDACGGMSDAGSCWCDDACADFGDCCSDKASVCDGGPDLCDDFVGPCQSDDDCGEGMECVVDPDTCSPSACGCDPTTGHVICTADCGGAECVPAEQPDLCEDFVGPCQSDDDCGEGTQCVFDPSTCAPSACGCDPDTGSILCTQDCGGLECLPVATECEQAQDCEEQFGPPLIECVGAHWECTDAGTCNQTCS